MSANEFEADARLPGDVSERGRPCTELRVRGSSRDTDEDQNREESPGGVFHDERRAGGGAVIVLDGELNGNHESRVGAGRLKDGRAV